VTSPSKATYLDMESETEESLMAAYASGDRQAFVRLFARIAPRVHTFFQRAFKDASVADELMQNTFVKLHRARATYHSDLPFSPWLFTIAIHVRRDEWRRRFRLPENADEEAIAAADRRLAMQQANEAAASDDRFSELRLAIAELPEIQRVVLQLHQYEGMTHAEIAAVLGTTPGAIRQHTFRAYGSLRKRLSGIFSENTSAERPW
jgi:RNA polymerase sigma factor (sigma-70 family)